MLTPMQKDAVTEILNIQLCYAANLLSEMVNQKIILSVPELDLWQGGEFGADALKRGELTGSGEAVLTTVTFGGSFSGNAVIVFPQDKASVLVNACLGNDIPRGADAHFSSEDADVIREISNIILNALIGEFGNILDVKLDYTSFETGFSLDFLEKGSFIPRGAKVLVLYTSFYLTKSQVRGVILIALSAPAYRMLIDKIDSILRDIDV